MLHVMSPFDLERTPFVSEALAQQRFFTGFEATSAGSLSAFHFIPKNSSFIFSKQVLHIIKATLLSLQRFLRFVEYALSSPL